MPTVCRRIVFGPMSLEEFIQEFELSEETSSFTSLELCNLTRQQQDQVQLVSNKLNLVYTTSQNPENELQNVIIRKTT